MSDNHEATHKRKACWRTLRRNLPMPPTAVRTGSG